MEIVFSSLTQTDLHGVFFPAQLGSAVCCHRVCPQALAEVLEVNKTITGINLGGNEIGKEGAKAWCLAQGSCTSRLRNREIKWNQGFV